MTNNTPSAWTQVKLATRRQVIFLLRGVTRRLQGVLEALETKEAGEQAALEAVPSLSVVLWAWLRSLRQGSLGVIRARMPAAWNRRLPDRALTGIVGATIALVLGITITLWVSTPTQVASKPVPSPTTAPVVDPSPSPLPSPESLPSLDPPPVPSPEPTSTPLPETTPVPSPSLELSPPSVSTAPVPTPSPVQPTPSPVQPTPSPVQPSSSAGTTQTIPIGPAIVPSPEQTLIASIQAQLSTALATLAQDRSDVIQSLKPDYPSSRLTVQVTDRWYRLESAQQDEFAEALRRQVTALDFSHLDLVDGSGVTIARSPVIGDRMVLLKRRT